MEKFSFKPYPAGGILVLLVLVFTWTVIPQNTSPRVMFPNPDPGAASLPARKAAQLKTVDQFKVFYQFQLTDKLKESDITFVHHIVDDAGKTYKQVHYDHGNGIAVTDVDGDGLLDLFVCNVGKYASDVKGPTVSMSAYLMRSPGTCFARDMSDRRSTKTWDITSSRM